MKTWFEPRNTMLDSYCTGYFATKPRILAEEYVKDIGNILYDYKMFCFDGTPLFMTEYDVSTPVTVRRWYVEGSGQLCEECYFTLYPVPGFFDSKSYSQPIENFALAPK